MTDDSEKSTYPIRVGGRFDGKPLFLKLDATDHAVYLVACHEDGTPFEKGNLISLRFDDDPTTGKRNLMYRTCRYASVPGVTMGDHGELKRLEWD